MSHGGIKYQTRERTRQKELGCIIRRKGLHDVVGNLWPERT